MKVELYILRVPKETELKWWRYSSSKRDRNSKVVGVDVDSLGASYPPRRLVTDEERPAVTSCEIASDRETDSKWASGRIAPSEFADGLYVVVRLLQIIEVEGCFDFCEPAHSSSITSPFQLSNASLCKPPRLASDHPRAGLVNQPSCPYDDVVIS
ncbi:hypothetical protein GALMADRAFT_216536 [Galerina marginata CBS 339.88]|uniref:Uncharacterized protein n=1 Tax=Galerina marginata (strain CBS 339.88) TaxID=685588 RepID=A0A067S8S9_GALM3|nr:hypothetical protein GALMADRAFT_216536 [Galerina marginata CBS 339.88]